MRRDYELGFILNPEVNEEQSSSILERIQQIVNTHDGQVVRINQWGRRRLAYPIEHQRDGFYVFFDMILTPETVSELDRNLKVPRKYSGTSSSGAIRKLRRRNAKSARRAQQRKPHKPRPRRRARPLKRKVPRQLMWRKLPLAAKMKRLARSLRRSWSTSHPLLKKKQKQARRSKSVREVQTVAV